MNSRAKYHELLGAATAVAVQVGWRQCRRRHWFFRCCVPVYIYLPVPTASAQAAVAGDSLAPVEVKSEGRAEELFHQLALPATFHTEVTAASSAATGFAFCMPPSCLPNTHPLTALISLLYIISHSADCMCCCLCCRMRATSGRPSRLPSLPWHQT